MTFDNKMLEDFSKMIKGESLTKKKTKPKKQNVKYKFNNRFTKFDK